MKNNKWAAYHYPMLLILILVLGNGALSQEISTSPKGSDHYLELGNSLLEKNKPQEALQRFARGLKKFPQNLELLMAAARAASAAEDLSDAVNYYYEAAKVAPDSYEVNLCLGRALRQQGFETAADPMTQNEGYMMVEDSLKFLRKAMEINKPSPEPCMELAYTLIELFDYEGAEEAACAALERSPNDVEALLLRGDLAYTKYMKAKKEDLGAEPLEIKRQEAMDFYLKAKEEDSEEFRVYMGIAALYEAEDKWNEAIQACSEAILRNPEVIQAYNQIVSLFSREEEEGSLVTYLENLLSKIEARYPDHPVRKATPLYYLGFALFQDLEFEKSIQAYSESASLNGLYSTGASYYIGRAAFELGDHESSLEKFFIAMEQDREGLVYFMKNDREFKNKVYPSLSFLTYQLVQEEKLLEARELNACVLEVIENDSSLYNNYAFLCRETRKYEDSYAAYRRALELDPSNPSILNDTALILHYHLHRDLDEAERLYHLAIEEANRILEENKSTDSTLEQAKVALRDATNNLRLLKEGVIDEQDLAGEDISPMEGSL